jgi:hypothetical protein
MFVRDGCVEKVQVRILSMRDLRLEEVDGDAKVRGNILEIDIGNLTILASLAMPIDKSTYRLAGSSLFRAFDLFTGSYSFTASRENFVVNDDCDSRSWRSSEIGVSFGAAAVASPDAYLRAIGVTHLVICRTCLIVSCRKADGSSCKAMMGILRCQSSRFIQIQKCRQVLCEATKISQAQTSAPYQMPSLAEVY